MSSLLILLCQAFDLAATEAERLPTTMTLESPARAGAAEQHIGADVFAVWTKWDDGLRIDEGWGYGGDVKFGLEWGTPVMFNIKIGYAGWYTENDAQQTAPGHTQVAQYRIGVGGDFATKFFDFGIYANLGLFHFHSRPDNDTARFFELQAIIAVKPFPHFKVGVTGMVTWVGTDYNRASTHTWTNHSIGPIIELTF